MSTALNVRCFVEISELARFDSQPGGCSVHMEARVVPHNVFDRAMPKMY
jgi:hypothetical protein